MIRSRPHRAVVALLRAGLGLEPGPRAVADLTDTPPERIVEIASAHRVLQALAPGVAADLPLRDALEPDLPVFLEEIRAGNLRRNLRILEILGDVGARLADLGIEAVALKGGAELAEGGPAASRFVGDLDLLVRPEAAAAAQRALIDAGWTEGPMSRIDGRAHHHLPQLTRPGLPGAVEIHRSLGGATVEAALPAAAVLAAARPSSLPGVLTPAAEHRLTHLALHAQIAEAGWRDQRLRLCDLADLHRLGALSGGAAAEAARRRLEAGGVGEIWDGLTLAATRLLGGVPPGPPPSPEARRWAGAAEAAIGRPGALRRRRLGRAVAWRLAALIGDAERRAHWAARLREPGALAQILGETARRIREIR